MAARAGSCASPCHPAFLLNICSLETIKNKCLVDGTPDSKPFAELLHSDGFRQRRRDSARASALVAVAVGEMPFVLFLFVFLVCVVCVVCCASCTPR